MAYVKEIAPPGASAVKKFWELSAFAEFLKSSGCKPKELGSKGNLVRVGAVDAAGHVVAMYDGFRVAA